MEIQIYYHRLLNRKAVVKSGRPVPMERVRPSLTAVE